MAEDRGVRVALCKADSESNNTAISDASKRLIMFSIPFDVALRKAFRRRRSMHGIQIALCKERVPIRKSKKLMPVCYKCGINLDSSWYLLEAYKGFIVGVECLGPHPVQAHF